MILFTSLVLPCKTVLPTGNQTFSSEDFQNLDRIVHFDSHVLGLGDDWRLMLTRYILRPPRLRPRFHQWKIRFLVFDFCAMVPVYICLAGACEEG